MIWVWHDDIRTPPSNRWEWAKTNQEVIDIFESAREEIQIASLDHDLGPEEGWELCRWMVDNEMFPTLEVILHSWNPAGARRMHDILKEGGCPALLTILPYSKNNYRGT